jgi:hypothetical protein
MRRLLVLAVTLALVAAPSAEAGPFSILKGAAKLSKLAKVGKVAKLGKVGALGKAGALGKGGVLAAKGGMMLTAAVAAERVFASVADDGARVAMFVTREGDDAFRVITRGGGDEVMSGAQLKTHLGELDEMAHAAPEAGVDVFLDPALAADVPTGVGAKTKWFAANPEGKSWEIVAGTQGPTVELWPNVRASMTMDVAGSVLGMADTLLPPAAKRTWQSLPSRCDAGVEGMSPATDDDPDFRTASRVVVLDDAEPFANLADRSLNHRSGFEFAMIRLVVDDPCNTTVPGLEAAASGLQRAPTLDAVWTALAALGTVEVTGAEIRDADALFEGVAGALPFEVAVHTELEFGGATAKEDEPPLFAKILAVPLGLVCFGFMFMPGVMFGLLRRLTGTTEKAS